MTIDTIDQDSLYQQPQISRVCEGKHFFLIHGCGGCRLSFDLTHVQKSCDRLTEWLFLPTQNGHMTLLDHLVLATTAPKDKHNLKKLKHTIDWCQELWFLRSPSSLPYYVRSFSCYPRGFQLWYIGLLMVLHIHDSHNLSILCFALEGLLLHHFSSWLNAAQGSFRWSSNHSNHHTQITWASVWNHLIHHWRHNPQATG